MLDAFDRGALEPDTMQEFIEHVSGCSDCQEEYEIYFIIKYALSDDDEKMDFDLAKESSEVRRLVNSYNFKELVNYRLKEAKLKIDKIKRNEYYNSCLFAIAEFSVLLMAVFYIFDNIFM